MADCGGDNPAAKHVAARVASADPKPDKVIHLGDIYYGGIKAECEAFLRNWPLQGDPENPGASIPSGTSFALNGNHEMYSGAHHTLGPYSSVSDRTNHSSAWKANTGGLSDLTLLTSMAD